MIVPRFLTAVGHRVQKWWNPEFWLSIVPKFLSRPKLDVQQMIGENRLLALRVGPNRISSDHVVATGARQNPKTCGTNHEARKRRFGPWWLTVIFARPSSRHSYLISQNLLIDQSQKVNFPTKLSTYCLLLPIQILS